nr:major pollen allergen car b 1 isoforms 1a and 1b [Quercus suber]
MGDFTYENKLIPKSPPQIIRNAEKIEGNGGPRTIKETIFVEGIGPMNHTKQISDDGVEQESLSYNIIGGDRNNSTFSNISEIERKGSLVEASDALRLNYHLSLIKILLQPRIPANFLPWK